LEKAIIFFAVTSALACSSFAQNKVLKLDGTNSYVELPQNIFTNLTEATVEVWAKWDAFRAYSRVFEFGAGYQSMSMFNHDRTRDLRFNLYPVSARSNTALQYVVRVNDLLELHEWIHLAVVSGPGGMKLYANGVLVGEHPNEASFADIKVSHTNLFGRGLARNPNDQDFRGQLDEIRVWDHRRTETQIRESISKQLTGREKGLVALWNFEDGTANDSSVNGYHGKLIGNAKVLPANFPGVRLAAASQSESPAAPSSVPATNTPIVAASSPDQSSGLAAWWIGGALTVIVGLLAWLLFMLRRSGLGTPKLLTTAPAQALLTDGQSSAVGDPAQKTLKERALVELTEFAKESLVQGLYSQRNALLEVQQKAQQELAALEARLASVRVPERITAYEKRIAELEKELELRGDEIREFAHATLLLLRQKIDQEKERESERKRF
jgi:hypothetical protein